MNEHARLAVPCREIFQVQGVGGQPRNRRHVQGPDGESGIHGRNLASFGAHETDDSRAATQRVADHVGTARSTHEGRDLGAKGLADAQERKRPPRQPAEFGRPNPVGKDEADPTAIAETDDADGRALALDAKVVHARLQETAHRRALRPVGVAHLDP